MKKIISISLALGMAILFTGCAGEEEDLFNKSAAERLNESKAIYTQRLAAALGGWVMEFYPTNGSSAPRGKGYLMLARFKADGSVMIAMQNEMSSNEYAEDTSLWEMIADQGPVLSFNSYNQCLHLFSDPAIYDTGLGYEGDYEFEVISLEENAQIAMLKGKKRGTYVRLTRLPEGTDFSEYLADVNAFHRKVFAANAINENVLVVSGEKNSINSGSTGIFGMYPYDGDAISQTTNHPFLITKRDGNYYLRFRSALSANDAEEQEFVYDEANDRFNGVENTENVIEGDNPNRFFSLWLSESHGWSAVSNSTVQDMSESFRGIYDAAADALNASSSKWAILSMTFTQDGDSLLNSMTIRNNRRQSTTIVYAYKLATAEENTTITYLGPVVTDKNQAAQTLLESTPALKTLVEAYAGNYAADSDTGSKFLLNKVRLTDKGNSGKWFDLLYSN